MSRFGLKLERVWASTLGFGKAWGPTLLIIAISASAGGVWKGWRAGDSASPASKRVVAIGRSYPKQLGGVYAGAWLKGAEALEAGRGVSEALGVVAEGWNAGRVVLFDRAVAPEFSKVVPEGKPDAEISASDKTALASLWRSFAAGLASPAK